MKSLESVRLTESYHWILRFTMLSSLTVSLLHVSAGYAGCTWTRNKRQKMFMFFWWETSCGRTNNECPPHKHSPVSSLRGQRWKVAAQCSRSCFGMQHFTQGRFSSVRSCDPELSLINHSTSGCFRKKTQMFTPKRSSQAASLYIQIEHAQTQHNSSSSLLRDSMNVQISAGGAIAAVSRDISQHVWVTRFTCETVCHMISVQSPWKHYCINIPALCFFFLKKNILS